MIYQLEHEEIDICNKCPMCVWCIDTEGCTLTNKLISGSKKPQENDCPLVAISKTETTSCEWCELKIIPLFYDESLLISASYCPNCGRKLKGE